MGENCEKTRENRARIIVYARFLPIPSDVLRFLSMLAMSSRNVGSHRRVSRCLGTPIPAAMFRDLPRAASHCLANPCR